MLKLGRVTKVKVLFLVLVFVFNFELFKNSAAILEKGLLVIGLRVVQFRAGVIVLVISNRPRASRSSDFEITRAITPWIVLHSVQLLLQIVRL